MSTIESRETVHDAKMILLVDDEPMLVELTSFSLTEGGYQVLTAGNGAEALKVAADQLAAIDLIITDSEMPGMSGRDLIARLRMERPELKAIISSGYTQDHVASSSSLDASIGFLSKPFDRKKLLNAVAQALNS